MSKRFPIPAYSYEQYKNMEWAAPALLSAEEQARLVAAAAAGSADAYGCYAVGAPEAFYDRFKLRGAHRHVRMCLLPATAVSVVGRSHAWAVQQALLVDSLDATGASVLHEWTTPRPMNTRLGPDLGVTLPGGIVYAVCSHRYADHWIVNRTLTASATSADADGFDLLSASDDDVNDFHACNLSFRWPR
jgi:hypothetical protein